MIAITIPAKDVHFQVGVPAKGSAFVKKPPFALCSDSVGNEVSIWKSSFEILYFCFSSSFVGIVMLLALTTKFSMCRELSKNEGLPMTVKPPATRHLLQRLVRRFVR